MPTLHGAGYGSSIGPSSVRSITSGPGTITQVYSEKISTRATTRPGLVAAVAHAQRCVRRR